MLHHSMPNMGKVVLATEAAADPAMIVQGHASLINVNQLQQSARVKTKATSPDANVMPEV